MQRAALTPAQRTALAAAAGVDPATIRRWADGASVRSTTERRIRAALAAAPALAASLEPTSPPKAA